MRRFGIVQFTCLALLALLAFLLPGSAATAETLDVDDLQRRVTDLYQRGKYAEGVPLSEQYSRARLEQNGPTARDYADALKLQAKYLTATKTYKEAAELYRRVLAIDEANFGPEHADVSEDLAQLAALLIKLYRPAEPEQLLQRAIAIDERTLGPRHPRIAEHLRKLAERSGRKSETEKLLRRALAIDEGADRPNSVAVVRDLTKLAEVLYNNDDDDPQLVAEAQALVRRARETAIVSKDPAMAEPLCDLAISMSYLIPDTGKAADWAAAAEQLYRQALALDEAAFAPDHPAIAHDLEMIAGHLESVGRIEDAIAVQRRRLGILEASLGPDHSDVAYALSALAKDLQRTDHAAEAVTLRRRILAIDLKLSPASRGLVAADELNLANVLRETGALQEAEMLYRSALRAEESQSAAETSSSVSVLKGLTQVLLRTQRHAEAAQLAQRMLAFHEKQHSPFEEDIAADLDILGTISGAMGDWPAALAYRRRLSDVFFRHRWPLMTSKQQGQLTYPQAFRAHALALRNALAGKTDGLDESFRQAQWALRGDAGRALEQMSKRVAAGSGPLADLLRERQSLSREREIVAGDIHRADFGAFPKIEERLRANYQSLKQQFPKYELIDETEPLSVAETQALLADDEAVLQFLAVPATGGSSTDGFLAWAITSREGFWVKLTLGPSVVSRHVETLRCGLDETLWSESVEHPDQTEGQRRARARQLEQRKRCIELVKSLPVPETIGSGTRKRAVLRLPFDATAAHALYRCLLQPFDEVIRGRKLMIVADGALTNLPFNVLVAHPPAQRIAAAFADYRRLDWLGSRQTMTILPSIQALKGLRTQAKKSRATRAFIGIGNPLLNGRQDDPVDGSYYRGRAALARSRETCPQHSAPVQKIARRSSETGSFAALFGGDYVDVDQLRQASPLPETADELCDVARFAGDSSDVLLGSRATETELKRLSASGDLAKYRVVHFATHGVLAGQIEGAAEPGLILTPPPPGQTDPAPLQHDDGYLSSSEISLLHLDADWVALSACNTAGSNGETSEALSGLARAFFFAGARAVLVSHWEVDSQAAVKLTTRAFAERGNNPQMPPALAMRRSMAALIRDDAVEHAHPSHWAPFMLVGEGLRPM